MRNLLLSFLCVAMLASAGEKHHKKEAPPPPPQMTTENKLAIVEAQKTLLSIIGEKAQLELRLHILNDQIPIAQQALHSAYATAAPAGYVANPDLTLTPVPKP